jgi:hypothetical protein
MGATAENLPGTLNLAMRAGDEFGTLLDFSISTTSYTWAAQVYSLLTGETLASPTVTVVNAGTGQVNVALTETQTTDLGRGSFGWRLEATAPGSVKRTMIDGICEIVA